MPSFLVAFLTFSSTPAPAATTHPLKASFGAFSNPSGIAVDEASGNVFVADGGSSNSVHIFGSEGGAPSGVAVTEIPGFKFNGEPSGLAIDNSATSSAEGALYVGDVQDDSVKKYTLNSVSEEYELVGELVAVPALREPLGVAVDAKGNVFVSDFATGGVPSVVEFSPSGVEIAHFEVQASLGHASALAFDSAGDLYVQSFNGLGVWKFTANGSGKIEPGTSPTQILPGSPTGIAIDQDTDTLYVAQKSSIAQYSASCVPIATPQGMECTPELEFGAGVLGLTQRVAVGASGDIYVVDRKEKDVALFESTLSIVPDVDTEATTGVKGTSATLNGTASAAGGPAASCEFQYATKAGFEAEQFEGASTAPCAPGGPFIGITKEPVKADVSGLSGGVAYVYRLVGSNENGLNFGSPLSFSTVGLPSIDASFISQVGLDDAIVEGLINPNGGPNAAEETTYFVEYVSAEDFEQKGEYANATKVPVGGEAIGSGTEGVKVSQPLSGLSPVTTYHFRIVAENEAGEVKGPDKTFTTFLQAATILPDGRAYEQVTPVEKNGANAAGATAVIQAARNGDAMAYLSRGGLPGSEGAQKYNTYLATRAGDWSTQGLLPPASGGSAAGVLGWSEDLSRAYVVQSDLPGRPTDLLQRENTTRALRTMVGEGANNIESAFNYVGSSEDGAIVVFETDSRLPQGGANNAPNTYAWNRESGEISLVGVLNSGLAPSKGTMAGSNEASFKRHYLQDQHTVSSDGSRVFFTDAGTGQIYLRQNPTQPQSPLTGSACGEVEMACTIQVSVKGKKPATFWGATPSGGLAFFTSPDKLTANANTGPGGEGADLYGYDVETGQLTDLTPDPTDANGAEVRGVLGSSEDGSRVYFAANGVLAAGATAGDCSVVTYESPGSGSCSLYQWREGAIEFIARLQLTEQYAATDSLNWLSRFAPLAPGVEKTARVSANGETLLFRSQGKLTDYDNEGKPEFYRYSAADGKLSCVSCNPTAAAPIGAATLGSIFVPTDTGVSPASALSRNLSADGNRVFFETPDKLVASDTNGEAGCPVVTARAVRSCQDVYEWEASGTGSCQSVQQNGGCLSLISTGTSGGPSYFGDASPSGEDAFFYTVQSLVGQDKDQIIDIYDARVGGGIAAQNPPSPPLPCEAEDCKEAAPSPPSTESPATPSFQGPANPKPCKKGKVRKHGKCVKKGKPHHKKKQAKKRPKRRHG